VLPQTPLGLRAEDFAQPADGAQGLLLRQTRPLAAHYKVIDAEKLAVARDLLLDRGLVADDEAVARKILERRGRPVFQPPRGIGVVFVFERAAAFLVRRRVLGADIALDRDRILDRGAAIFLQRRPIGLHQRRDLAEAAAVDDQPGIAD